MINDVCDHSRQDFEEGGVELATLDLLRSVGQPPFLSHIHLINSSCIDGEFGFIPHHKFVKQHTSTGTKLDLWRVEWPSQVLGDEVWAGRATIGGEAGISRFLREAGRTPLESCPLIRKAGCLDPKDA